MVVGLLRAATRAHEVARSGRPTRVVARRVLRRRTVRITERYARSTKGHTQPQHERRDQDRYTLLHLLSLLDRKPLRKTAIDHPLWWGSRLRHWLSPLLLAPICREAGFLASTRIYVRHQQASKGR